MTGRIRRPIEIRFSGSLLTSLALAGMGVSNSADVVAQEANRQVIQNRIANFREIGTAYKSIGDELKESRPSVQRILDSAQLIEHRGADMLSWFPPGSEPSSQPEKTLLDRILSWFSSDDALPLDIEPVSHAKRRIWEERSEFELAHSRFEAAADRMTRATKTEGIAAISAQFRALGATCKGCHDTYREQLD